ncbi:MAG TPA: hypothetical protein VFP65_05670 [Anaeromyxobacteraceae bacterium]|nr:hypothetical protein [Anaeromyxobacteraceae bacterium]
MPWFAYECESCGARVHRQRPVAYRELAPHHNDADGCWDGVLRRLGAVGGARAAPPRASPGGGERGAGEHVAGR